jgi:hypothetical protein
MIQNDGSGTDSFTVQGTGSSTGFTVKYYVGTAGGSDITAAVTSGTYSISNLPAANNRVIRAVVNHDQNSWRAAQRKIFSSLRLHWAIRASRDTVKATVRNQLSLCATHDRSGGLSSRRIWAVGKPPLRFQTHGRLLRQANDTIVALRRR